MNLLQRIVFLILISFCSVSNSAPIDGMPDGWTKDLFEMPKKDHDEPVFASNLREGCYVVRVTTITVAGPMLPICFSDWLKAYPAHYEMYCDNNIQKYIMLEARHIISVLLDRYGVPLSCQST